MDTMAERVLVIGVGNLERGDDAAGILVAQRLAESGLPGVRVVEHDGEAGRLMDLMETAECVFLVDTAVSSSPGGADWEGDSGAGAAGALPAGTVRRYDAHLGPLPADLQTFSTHAFGAVQAVELARALGKQLDRLVVYAIEGTSFGFGEAPGEAVLQGVEEVVRRVGEEIGDLEFKN